jgi:hypothetical protein
MKPPEPERVVVLVGFRRVDVLRWVNILGWIVVGRTNPLVRGQGQVRRP